MDPLAFCYKLVWSVPLLLCGLSKRTTADNVSNRNRAAFMSHCFTYCSFVRGLDRAWMCVQYSITLAFLIMYVITCESTTTVMKYMHVHVLTNLDHKFRHGSDVHLWHRSNCQTEQTERDLVMRCATLTNSCKLCSADTLDFVNFKSVTSTAPTLQHPSF